jgi:RNA polymerase sigma-70 factor (ECF subfamily)
VDAERLALPAEADAASAAEEWTRLSRVAAGSVEEFGPLVERYQDRVVRLCERFLGRREEALDAAQEVFLKVFRHASRARPRGRFYTWIYRIAVNHCLNQLRRRRVVRFFSLDRPADDDGVGLFEPASPAADAEADLLTRERWRRTRRAIDALPSGQRAVLLLARFEGLSQREIAAALGISEGAVESRLVRAMRRLREAQEAAELRVAEGR